MKIKTSELTGAALDWAVAKCEGVEVEYINDGITRCLLRVSPFTGRYSPSTIWAQGGPVIEREIGNLWKHNKLNSADADVWYAAAVHTSPDGTLLYYEDGLTPLIAAMRCYVASKLGDEVEIPNKLVL